MKDKQLMLFMRRVLLHNLVQIQVELGIQMIHLLDLETKNKKMMWEKLFHNKKNKW